LKEKGLEKITIFNVNGEADESFWEGFVGRLIDFLGM